MSYKQNERDEHSAERKFVYSVNRRGVRKTNFPPLMLDMLELNITLSLSFRWHLQGREYKLSVF